MNAAEKLHRSPGHQSLKNDMNTEDSPNQKRNVESLKIDGRPKLSSFLYGEQFREANNSQTNQISDKQKLQSSEDSNGSGEDNHTSSGYYRNPTSKAMSRSVDDGSISTCSEDDNDFVAPIVTTLSKSFNSSLPGSLMPTAANNKDTVSPPFVGFPSMAMLKPTQTRRPEFHNRLPLSSSRCDLPNYNFFSGLQPPVAFSQSPNDDNDNDDGATGGIGSELLVAAYNNFVRKLVDETLDRTITFCEQPRNTISALERICSKAWPHLESKRHRNRIRAYLKACRRNSKKNRGQINMKEPPMNALSVEARQMVAAALNLVMKDIEQLRQDLKRDNCPSVFTAKNIALPPNLRRPEPHIRSAAGKNACGDGSGLQQSGSVHTSVSSSTPSSSSSSAFYSTASQQPGHVNSNLNRNTIFSNSFGRADDRIFGASKNCNAVSSEIPTPALPSGFDPECVSKFLRFFPSAFQFGTDFGANFRNAAMQAAMLMNGSGGVGISSTVGEPKPEENEKLARFLQWTREDNHHYHHDGSCTPSKREKREYPHSPTTHPSPAAHFAAVKYSPSLNEATNRLMDVRPLTQDDIAFFQHYHEIMQEALDYAKGISQMLLKKVEIIEGHFRLRKANNNYSPVNFSTN